ncbi:MAG: OmpA family protein [Methylovulum sp.]|nr:MAG: OmpA family protein [Methylovulum sp.]
MLKKHLLAAATLTSLGALPFAHAVEPQDKRWYVAPFATFINTGGDRGAQDGWGGGMGVGKMIDQHFNVELKGFYQGFDKKPGTTGEWQLAGATADVQYFFSRNAFAPYTVIGIGGMNTRVSGIEDASFIGEAGAGFTYELHDNFLLRSDVRYRYNNNFDTTFGRSTDEFHDMTVNVGFVIPLGPKPKAEKFEVPTPAPTPVAAAPDCSTLDSDADGINDCIDQCPATISGSKVDNQGCPVSLELKGVNFKYDSAELTPNAMSILDAVAANLINYPQKDDIEVHGHTSSEGSDSYNMRLSQRRSQSVVDYLLLKGVSNRLTARGYGESQPVADNSTEEGRSLNRRVELIWMGN